MGKKTNSTTKANASTKRAAKPALTNPPAVRKPAAITAKPVKPVSAKPKSAPKSAAPRSATFTTEDVALRAYFIAEKRRQEGLSGDEHNDWIEAERQLLAESKALKQTKKLKSSSS